MVHSSTKVKSSVYADQSSVGRMPFRGAQAWEQILTLPLVAPATSGWFLYCSETQVPISKTEILNIYFAELWELKND